MDILETTIDGVLIEVKKNIHSEDGWNPICMFGSRSNEFRAYEISVKDFEKLKKNGKIELFAYNGFDNPSSTKTSTKTNSFELTLDNLKSAEKYSTTTILKTKRTKLL